MSFHPLSGNSFLIPGASSPACTFQSLSFPSPLGEFISHTQQSAQRAKKGILFPSPLGEFISHTAGATWNKDLRKWFPSPLGEFISHTGASTFLKLDAMTKFPSPLGEFISHTAMVAYRVRIIAQFGFHPLSGNSFLIRERNNMNMIVKLVSIPSRGIHFSY